MLERADRLNTVHPRLADVVRKAALALPFDLLVVEGVRTPERQAYLVKIGASRILKSRHLPDAEGLSRAVDLAPMVDGHALWDWPLFPQINNAMQRAADDLGVVLVWGGDWRKFRDGPHWELG